MKILAIHNNKMFFKKDAPNFYEWLCKQRGLSEPYQELKEEYEEGKKGPKVLYPTYRLAVLGLTPLELQRYANKYLDEYQPEKFFKEITDKLAALSLKFKVMIFTSLPREIYINMPDYVYKVFGANHYLDDWGLKIAFLKPIELIGTEKKAQNRTIRHYNPRHVSNPPKNVENIKKMLNNLGLKDLHDKGEIEMGMGSEFIDENLSAYDLHIEPNRYGMLVYLIDQIIELGVKKEDVIVVGKGITAEPTHKVAGKVVEDLDEL